ncbi:MAG: hypothetical protein ACOCVF_03480 [bacterium]
MKKLIILLILGSLIGFTGTSCTSYKKQACVWGKKYTPSEKRKHARKARYMNNNCPNAQIENKINKFGRK